MSVVQFGNSGGRSRGARLLMGCWALALVGLRVSLAQGVEAQEIRLDVIAETEHAVFHAHGVSLCVCQPAIDEVLDLGEVPKEGGPFAALLDSRDAQKLEQLFSDGVKPDVLVSDASGEYRVRLLRAGLRAVRERAGGRSLVLLEAPEFMAVQTGPFARGLEGTTVDFMPSGVGPLVAVNFTTTDASGLTSVGANSFIAGTVAENTLFGAKAAPLTTMQVLKPSAATTLCNGRGAAACAAGSTKSVTVTIEATGPTGTMPNPFAGGNIHVYSVTGEVTGTPYDEVTEVWQLLATLPGSGASLTDDGVTAPNLRRYNYSFSLDGSLLAAPGAGPAVVNLVAIAVDSAGDGLISQFNLNVTVVAGR